MRNVVRTIGEYLGLTGDGRNPEGWEWLWYAPYVVLPIFIMRLGLSFLETLLASAVSGVLLGLLLGLARIGVATLRGRWSPPPPPSS